MCVCEFYNLMASFLFRQQPNPLPLRLQLLHRQALCLLRPHRPLVFGFRRQLCHVALPPLLLGIASRDIRCFFCTSFRCHRLDFSSTRYTNSYLRVVAASPEGNDVPALRGVVVQALSRPLSRGSCHFGGPTCRSNFSPFAVFFAVKRA